MLRLESSLQAWGSPDFKSALKAELEGLGAAALPLQQAVTLSSVALDTPPTVIYLDASEDGDFVVARIGVFFEGMITGCSCADDPTPETTQNEYCELELRIDKRTADTAMKLTG